MKINNFRNKIKQYFCNHEFKMEDIHLTKFKPQEKPKTNSYEDWCNYYSGIYTHISHTHRVRWRCNKCNKKFYAHCGLDIAPRFGYIVR